MFIKVVVFIFLGLAKTIMSYNGLRVTNGEQELSFELNKTWDGRISTDVSSTIHFSYKALEKMETHQKSYLSIVFTTPFYDDPPPEDFTGYTPGLWNFEVMEFFFANQAGQYIEIELNPYGHWLVYAFNGYRDMRNNCEDVSLNLTNNILPDNKWECRVDIPLALLPSDVNKFNAYRIHGLNEDRKYEALYPSTDKEQKEPDFHKVEFFKKLNTKYLLPPNFAELQKDDHDYSYIWNA
uniref:Carb-bd_dom_fam9 domain-containing protein n=1 Tax=Rhabditophanes sp. KR3021 TaxID=114890 RepID=A0AC35TH38_9BILA